MRRIIFKMIAILTVLLISYMPNISASSGNVKVNIDGAEVNFTSKTGIPFVDINGRTQVPLRISMEAIGATVDWNQETKTASVSKGKTYIEVPVDKNYITVNGNVVLNDTAAVIIDSKTYLPIRAVLEALGAKVGWDNNAQTVMVDSNGGVHYRSPEEIPYIDRIWVDIPYEIDQNSINQRVLELNEQKTLLESEIEEAHANVNYMINKNAGGITSYLITGEILLEDRDYYIVSGQAYGMGIGLQKGIVKVLKPAKTPNFNMFSGNGYYIGYEYNNLYGKIAVYSGDNGSSTFSWSTIEGAMDIKAALETELDETEEEIYNLTKPKIWVDYPCITNFKENTKMVHNSNFFYTVKVPEGFEVSVEHKIYDTEYVTSESMIFIYQEEDMQVQYRIKDYHLTEAEVKEFLNKRLLDGFKRSYTKIDELINVNNGVMDAYLQYNEDSNHHYAYIVTEKGVISVDVGNCDNADTLFEIIHGILNYPAVIYG
ncbi:copper amine oxidase-like protein [Natranaerovirga pectinivora]|uniref:Copper amine oxidase-like protein n=1 Tax=Natranaerovirga pectinivora TaxID=682400 RepID=A0A4R3MJI0_9FIRM|nr:copper amine oxidase N-terminal domain-containing protein [Natranaerovirga pectinivora]TCT14559.1 copper amine oxidase-like protein [Natranaerovirga pectinivora]